MYHDDSQRGTNNSFSRKPMSQKFNDKNNFNGNNAYGYTNNANYNGQQRRRPDRQKPSGNDRLIKQNDLIIKLLKEIRDRLPEPEGQQGKQVVGNETESSTPEFATMGSDSDTNHSEMQETLEDEDGNFNS